MSSDIRLGAVSFDASDVTALADFWRELLGLEIIWTSDTFIALGGAGIALTVQYAEDHQPSDWPAGSVPKQMHLELAVDSLDDSQEKAIALGASVAAHQPSPERWRVLIDPAGHPFCVTTLIRDI
jgi:catechol-2,3-dioxygenase